MNETTAALESNIEVLQHLAYLIEKLEKLEQRLDRFTEARPYGNVKRND